MDSPQIRFAREADLEAIAEIYNREVLTGTATFDTEPRSIEDLRAWLLRGDPRCPTLVAVEGGQVAGFAALYPWSPRKAYAGTAENAVYLHPDRRGLGVGKRLLQAILDEGRKAGLHTVIARVSSGNEASVRLHRKLGFALVGTMKEVGNKFGVLRDVDLLQLIL